MLIVLGVVHTGFNSLREEMGTLGSELRGDIGMLRADLRTEVREGFAEANLRLDEHVRLLSEHAERLTRLETILESQQQPAP